jgi:hypothetical protein
MYVLIIYLLFISTNAISSPDQRLVIKQLVNFKLEWDAEESRRDLIYGIILIFPEGTEENHKNADSA